MHRHISGVGSKATEASEVTLGLSLPFSLVLVLTHRALLPVRKGYWVRFGILLIEWASEKMRYRESPKA